MDWLLRLQSPPLSLYHPHKRQASRPGGGRADLIFPRPFSEGILRMPRHGWCPPAEKCRLSEKETTKPTPALWESGLPPQRQASQATKFSGWRSPQGCQSHRAMGTEGKHYHLRGVSGIDPRGAQLLPPPECGPSGRRKGPRTRVPGYHLGLNYSDRHPQGTTQPHPIWSMWCRQEAFRAEMSVNKENKSRASIRGSKKDVPSV